MVLMPPGSAKSTYASVIFPAWWFTQHPTSAVIAASHTADLAEHFGRQVRNLVAEHGPRLGYTLACDNRAAARWQVSTNGQYFATGVRGPITGRRADLAIIDDPVKSQAEADNAYFRDHLWNWYRSDLTTRLKPGGRVVLIMTRWHEDDLGGRLLAQQAAEWRTASAARAGRRERSAWPRSRRSALAGVGERRRARTQTRRGGRAGLGGAVPAELHAHLPARCSRSGRSPCRSMRLLPQAAVPSAPGTSLQPRRPDQAIRTGPSAQAALNERGGFIGARCGPAARQRSRGESGCSADRSRRWRQVRSAFRKTPAQAGKFMVQQFTSLLAGYNLIMLARDRSQRSRAPRPSQHKSEAGNLASSALLGTHAFIEELRDSRMAERTTRWTRSPARSPC